MWLLMLYILILPSVTESVTFEIVHKGKVVGEMSAVREWNGGQVIYKNTTTVRTQLIRQVEVQYRSCVTYENGVLQEATVKTLLNGSAYSDVRTQKSGGGYQFYKNGKLKRDLSGPITYSALQMLFDEPVGIASAYSEEAGDFIAIQAAGKAVYSKINSKGRANKYYYENNFLRKIEIDAGIVAFEMIRSD